MKKQYMDFVPATSVAKTTEKRTAQKTVRKVQTSNTKTQVMPSSKKREEAIDPRTRIEAKTTDRVGFAGEKKPQLGAVENLNTRFVRSDVPKRPLSRTTHFTTGKTGIAAAKAQKIGLRGSTSVKPVEKPVEKSKTKKSSKGTYQAPKVPFVNQEKVSKRPLSAKNVYPKKKIEVKTEEPKGPVTIIEKPEKQAHAGMIITIILTIILGAAAGTVAFLLLPK